MTDGCRGGGGARGGARPLIGWRECGKDRGAGFTQPARLSLRSRAAGCAPAREPGRAGEGRAAPAGTGAHHACRHPGEAESLAAGRSAGQRQQSPK